MNNTKLHILTDVQSGKPIAASFTLGVVTTLLKSQKGKLLSNSVMMNESGRITFRIDTIKVT